MRNEDGKQRQEIIARCRAGEVLRLEREPTNPVDANAIRIYRTNGEMLGYIAAHLAERDLACVMDSARHVSCRITDLTGGDEGKLFGVNIEVVIDADLAKQADDCRAHMRLLPAGAPSPTNETRAFTLFAWAAIAAGLLFWVIEKA